MSVSSLVSYPDSVKHQIPPIFNSKMNVPVHLYLDKSLYQILLEEQTLSLERGFISPIQQLVNTACLPGLVGQVIGLPDLHSGYGFAIGSVAAFDMDNPQSIVSPGGVGYDINCGVRLIRTNLNLHDVDREVLTQKLFDAIPLGMGNRGLIALDEHELDQVLELGIDWAIQQNYAWEDDRDFCEDRGRIMPADSDRVSKRAKTRGKLQMGSLGSGNHYLEIQAVEEIHDVEKAEAMGITELGQVCIMIHCGSRGLGHQVATDYIGLMQASMIRDGIVVPDRQLASARIDSDEGQNYIKAMGAAANYAYCNRSLLTNSVRKVFEETFGQTARDLDMGLVYDVSHNMAKIEHHIIDGEEKTVLVHRKGATRALPPGHAGLPPGYRQIGQPALIGGSMGTCSYVLTGTQTGMIRSFGSTCHGAGRSKSRCRAKREKDHQTVLDTIKSQGISIRVASPQDIAEEAPDSYKDVVRVVDTCVEADLCVKVVKLVPIGVIKG